MWVYACPQFDEATMQCDGAAWVQLPESQPVLPPLTLGEGVMVALAIVSVWAMGLALRIYIRTVRA